MEFIDYRRRVTFRSLTLSSADFISAAEKSNIYISSLTQIFRETGFDIFYSLGQRNISGFIGEIYKHILAQAHPALCANPHPDGRPDLLALDTPEAADYYAACFSEINGRQIPVKDKLTPFPYGGLEVKCSIGSSDKRPTQDFIARHGHSFSLYESRAGYLSGITWWAHHSSSSNLLGLYYDYYAPLGGIPQILAAFYAELTADDWHAVSRGDPRHKKTSNTSLNKSGLSKMKANCIFSVDDKAYIDQLRKIGVKI